MQVSHHPPILAFQSESTAGSYQVYGEIEIKNKFWGRSIEVSERVIISLALSQLKILVKVFNLIAAALT